MPPRTVAPFGRLPGPLARSATRTLARVITVLRPREGIYDVDVDDAVLATMLRFVPFMAPPLRLAFPFGLLLLEHAPVMLRFGFTRFRSMDGDDARAYIEKMAAGPEPLSLLADGLRALVMIAFYQQPEIMAAFGIDWASRAKELTERRAKLLRMEPSLANPRNAGAPR
jgi:hypothetical protein